MSNATTDVTGTLQADCRPCDEADIFCPFDGRQATREQIAGALDPHEAGAWITILNDGDLVRPGRWEYPARDHHVVWVDLDVEDAVAIYRLGLLGEHPDDRTRLREATEGEVDAVLAALGEDRWSDVRWYRSQQQDYLLAACEHQHGQEYAWIDATGRLDVIAEDGDVLRTDIVVTL